MAKKTFDDAADADQDISARPVRVRPLQKSKGASRSRKNRRKPAAAPGGIHQRANKRMSW
jgi:hypothetical protein